MLALMVIALPVGLVGCKKSVYGKYTFAEMKITYTGDVTAEEKAEIEEMVKEQEAAYKGFYITLNKDGTIVNGMDGETEGDTANWKKEGNKYIVYTVEDGVENIQGELTIKNGKMYMDFSEVDEDAPFKVQFVFKK